MKTVNLFFAVGIVVFCFLGVNGFAATINVPGDQPTIQAGIDAATNGDTVLIADGTYTGTGNVDVNFDKDGVVIESVNGPEVCIIDCEQNARAFYIPYGPTEASIIRGLTIKNGHSNGAYPLNCGGGILIYNSSPKIENCIFYFNWADAGGAVFIDEPFQPSATIVDCKFLDNFGYIRGGAMCLVDGAETEINNCIFTGNTAYDGIGGAGGGAISTHNAFPHIENCLFFNNESDEGGALHFDFNSVPSLQNCTIANNNALNLGGGIYLKSSYGPSATNSIIWNNTPDQLFLEGSDIDITYSDVQDGHSGVGNINSDPLFVTGVNGNFYLSQTSAGQAVDSPCLNSGSDLASMICYGLVCMSDLTTRSDEIPDEFQVDMGFHYYTSNIVTPTPTSTYTPTVTPTIPCTNHGDVNFDGSLTAGDAQLSFLIALGSVIPSFAEACAADCDGNGQVTAGDAQSIFVAALYSLSCVDPI